MNTSCHCVTAAEKKTWPRFDNDVILQTFDGAEQRRGDDFWKDRGDN